MLRQDIVNEPDEITTVKGQTIPRRLSVDYLSFSAHVDGPQNAEFISQVKAQHVVSITCLLYHVNASIILQELVHGEQTAMGRLRASLQQKYKDRDEEIKIHTPRNLETLNLIFRGERVAKVRCLPSSLPLLTTVSRPSVPSQKTLQNPTQSSKAYSSRKTTHTLSSIHETCVTSLGSQLAKSLKGRESRLVWAGSL